MEMMASASAPSTTFHISLAQAVLTLSINAILVFLTAIIKSSTSSSSSSSRRRDATPGPTAAAAANAAPPAPSPAKPAAAAIDMDVVLAVMGAAGAQVSVGFEEATALFEEEEATVEEARAAFAVFDRDGDGFIDAAELGSVLKSLGFDAAADCQRMIDAYDDDKDGRIDFREFVKLMETSS